MAPLQLSQVQGSDTITQAALQVGWQTQVAEWLGFNFGDPNLIQQVAAQWSTASTRVTAAKGQIALSSRGGATAYADAAHNSWTGDAASQFFPQETVLENGFTTVSTAMDTTAKSLNDLVPVINAAWASSVATTLALIYDLAKLIASNGGAAVAGIKTAIKNVQSPPGPSTPAQPVIGPGGIAVQTLPPVTAQTAPNNNSGGTTATTSAAADIAKKIMDLLKAWIAALMAHIGIMLKYNQQVTMSMTALQNALTANQAQLPNGGLPTVPSLPAS